MKKTQQPKLQSLSLRFITTTRDGLADIGRALADGIDPSFFADEKNPVMVSLRGSYDSGKSLVAREMRYALAQGREQISDGFLLGKSWVVSGADGKIEFSAIDVADEAFSNGHHYNTPVICMNAFLNQRQYGGVSFLQNCHENNPAGIHVWVEKHVPDIVGYCGIIPLIDAERGRGWDRARKSGLWEAFEAAAAQDESWARYVEIDISDERLIHSPAFMKTFNALSSRAHKAEQMYNSSLPLKKQKQSMQQGIS